MIEHINAKIGTLERRSEHLQRQLDENDCSRGARSFISSELSALKAALVALRLHQREVDQLEKPMAVMRELLEAIEKRKDLDPELTLLLERASTVVADFAA